VATTASSVSIVPTAEFHIPGLHAALDQVAKERRHLAFLAAPPFAASTGQFWNEPGVIVSFTRTSGRPTAFEVEMESGAVASRGTRRP
jgi:hypothetical protein